MSKSDEEIEIFSPIFTKKRRNIRPEKELKLNSRCDFWSKSSKNSFDDLLTPKTSVNATDELNLPQISWTQCAVDQDDEEDINLRGLVGKIKDEMFASSKHDTSECKEKLINCERKYSTPKRLFSYDNFKSKCDDSKQNDWVAPSFSGNFQPDQRISANLNYDMQILLSTSCSSSNDGDEQIFDTQSSENANISRQNNLSINETNTGDFGREFLHSQESPTTEPSLAESESLNFVKRVTSSSVACRPELEKNREGKTNRVKKSGDFAAYIMRIIENQESNVKLWHHANPKEESISHDLPIDALKFRILSVREEYGQFLFVCQTEPLKNLHNTDEESQGQDWKAVITFDRKTMEQFSIEVGCSLIIYSPYQKLINSKFSCPVFIGPKYFHVFSN